ncbi:pyridoxamine 5'-phosphate oxidase family protein [Periweissella cryptocerci]|uniref:Pyridoxamine 5'-phosphate oxidase family protein n=1 Tax=Periweissella cryptocerci TaxID=2506420 RepID=A0A4V1AIY5_9LACO|nr:pyridoxamine 5'-phosphate oxidase family protein [Periweissella cryptocerci]QBO37125.1 pyridoxamine 5'-phosphate oxidase family protein [Periweissella cryptocerci]
MATAEELFEAYFTNNANHTLALATATADGVPNIRHIFYAPNPEQMNQFYIATIHTSPKNHEFEDNDKVSFITPVKEDGVGYVASNSAVIKKSAKQFSEIEPLLAARLPEGFQFKGNDDAMNVYEITFASAKVSDRNGAQFLEFA